MAHSCPAWSAGVLQGSARGLQGVQPVTPDPKSDFGVIVPFPDPANPPLRADFSANTNTPTPTPHTNPMNAQEEHPNDQLESAASQVIGLIYLLNLARLGQDDPRQPGKAEREGMEVLAMTISENLSQTVLRFTRG